MYDASIVSLDEWNPLRRELHIFGGLLAMKKSESGGGFSVRRSGP